MTQYRPLDDPNAAAAGSGMVRVVVPPEHQGVVNALRTAYSPDRPAMPDDMMRLLERLR